jgi:hypothetical protein
MEFLLIFLVAGGLIWALVWAASGRDDDNGDNDQ